ncbi:YicC family protein [bacterium]|nr:YicC family protein [bacterium]
MILSMTGFGRADTTFEGGTFTVEVRSVNHRFTDISIRLPRALNNLESLVRETIKARVQRGSVSVNVNWERAEDSDRLPTLNEPLLLRYRQILQRMSQLGVEGEPNLDTLCRLPEIFSLQAREVDEQAARPVLEAALNEALDRLVEMRGREGDNLAADILARLGSMSAVMDEIAVQGPQRLERLTARLREKVTAALEGVAEPDPARLVQEITIYADKWDISEEQVRFRSHLEALRQALSQGGAVGRRLNFLIQELNREVNTVGSKANDASIAQLVVGLKEELERIREQVENME